MVNMFWYIKNRVLMKKFIALFIFVMAAFSMNAQTVKQRAPQDKIAPDPAVTIGSLSNGIKYYIRENKKPENRAELRIVFKAGAVQETDAQSGLAHFIEHMCFNGTKHFPKNDLIKFFEKTGMRFGGDVNANTGFDRTLYLLTIPLDKPGLIEEGFQVLEDWAHNVSFDPEELEKERGVIKQEYTLYLGAQQRIQQHHLKNYLYGSKFADRLPIGKPEIFMKAPREEFVKFYTDWYRPDLTAVVAVGDFKKDDIEKLIKKHFSGIKNPESPKEREDSYIPVNKEPIVSIAKDKELPMCNVTVMFKHAFEENMKDTYGAYKNSIVERLFSSMLTQRLTELTRKAKPAFLYAGGGEGEFMANLKATNGVCVTQPEGIMTGYEALLTEMFRVKQHGFTAGELERSKTEILKGLEAAYKEKDKTKSASYADEYYRNFYENESMPGIEAELEMTKEYLKEITLNDVNAIAPKNMKKEGLVIAVSAQEKEGVTIPTEKDIMGMYDKMESTKFDPYIDASTDMPLIANKPAPGKVVETKETGKFGVKEMKLSNGARVLIKKTDFKNDEILFRAYSKGGTSVLGDNDYIAASLADGMESEAGIADFDKNTLDKMMTGKQFSVSPYISDLTQGFSGYSTPEDFETMMQMVYLYFTAPRKDADAFESYMGKVAEQIKNAKRSPDAVYRDTLNAVLGGYHKRAMPMTEKEIKAVKLDQAYDLFRQRFADPSGFTFIFVGNFDDAVLKSMLETYIASIPAKNLKESFKDVGEKAPKGIVKKEVKKGIEPKASVSIVITDKFDYNVDNMFACKSMVEILSIRLREVIREDKGGVYGIGARASFEQYPTPSYSIRVGFGTVPERVDELVASINDVINEVKNGKFDKEYISKVQEILKREWETSQKENGFWVSNIYNSDFNNLDLGRYTKYNEMVDKIDMKSVTAAAKKYLNTNNWIQVVLNPED